MKRCDLTDDLDAFGRFGEPALLILVSLANGPKHGYAMTGALPTSPMSGSPPARCTRPSPASRRGA